MDRSFFFSFVVSDAVDWFLGGINANSWKLAKLGRNFTIIKGENSFFLLLILIVLFFYFFLKINVWEFFFFYRPLIDYMLRLMITHSIMVLPNYFLILLKWNVYVWSRSISLEIDKFASRWAQSSSKFLLIVEKFSFMV